MNSIQKKELNYFPSGIFKKVGVNIFISWLFPCILVIVLSYFSISNTVALAIAGAIPFIRTIIVLILRRKVDWIGVVGALSFVVALIVTLLSGGSSLPLKLYHPVITGTIGLIFIASIAIGKPLLLIILQMLKRGNVEQFKNPEFRKTMTVKTALIGVIFTIDAGIHIIMALTLSTVAYLTMSRIVTIILIIALIATARLNFHKSNQVK